MLIPLLLLFYSLMLPTIGRQRLQFEKQRWYHSRHQFKTERTEYVTDCVNIERAS